MAQAKLAILVEAIGAAKAARELKGVDAAVSRIGARTGRGIRDTASNLKTLGFIAGGVVVGGLAGAVKAAADFESQLNIINTVANVNASQLDAIGKSIRQIAKDTGTPIEELTQGYYDLVSAGIDASQAQAVLASSNTLAIGGLSTAAESVDLLTTALNSYGVEAKNQGTEAARFADIFAKSIENGKVTAEELAASFAQVGPLAASLGIEVEEVAAGYAQMTSKGVPAAEAATQMASAMTALLRKTTAMEKLEKQTGKNYTAIAGSRGLAAAFEELRKDAEKAGIPIIELVGRKEALQFQLMTTGAEMENYTRNLEDMSNAEGTAARQMAARQTGLNYQLGRLKALAIEAGIVIGSKLLPKITPLAEKAVKFLETHEGDIERFGDEIAKAFDKALQFAQKIPWGTIGDGLKVAAEWSGKLMDAFLSMPKEVQTTLIALAGLNKLSGGAITGIVGELGKGLIKGVLGMTAGVVNIKAGVVTGAGGVGTGVGGPAAAGGGRLGGALRLGAAATGVGIAGAGLREGGDMLASAVANGNKDLEATIKRSNEGLLRSLGPIGQLAYLPDDIDRLINGQQGQTRVMGGMLDRLTAEQRAVKNVTAAGLAAVRASINAKAFSPRITIPVYLRTQVSARNIVTTQKTIARFGQIGRL